MSVSKRLSGSTPMVTPASLATLPSCLRFATHQSHCCFLLFIGDHAGLANGGIDRSGKQRAADLLGEPDAVA